MKRAVAFLILPLAIAFGAAGGCGGRPPAGGSAVEREVFRHGARYVLQSRLEPRRVTLGDPAHWTISAELPPSARVDTMALAPSASTLDILAERAASRPPAAKPAGPPGRNGWTESYGVRAFDLGSVALPVATLYARRGTVQDTLEFPGDTIQVDSLTPASTGSMEAERGPIPTELRPIDIALAIVAGLLLVGGLVAATLLFLRARRARRKVEVPIAPPDPPDTILLREIDALRAELESLARDRFHDRLSFAVRRYVAAVTPVAAPDRTTREIERELSALSHVGPETARAVTRVLRKSDLVKFARAGDKVEEARAALDEAALLPSRFARGATET